MTTILMADQRPAHALLDLLGSHRITAAIYAAVQLGVTDALADRPRSYAALAVACDCDELSLGRLLDALVTIGICRRVGPDRFELTELGAPLAADAAPSLKAWALFEGDLLWKSWGGLAESIRGGETAAELAGETDRFRLLARDPAALKTFNAAMNGLTQLVASDVLEAYDFTGVNSVMDVGGGTGELLVSLLQVYPAMRGLFWTWPSAGSRPRLDWRS